MGLTVQEISQRIGARIETDKATLVSGARSSELRQLLETRGVLVFPRIHLTDDEQLAFALTLGDIVGQVFALLVLTVAAAETAIGLAILVVYFRNRGSIAVEDVNLMKG